MKPCLFIIIIVFLIPKLQAQKYFDLGLTGGTTYYLGDINASRQFYRPSPAFGAFARYNLNNREALHISITRISLQANDADFKNAYQQLRDASFKNSFVEIASTFEFNFLPYVTNKIKNGFSPFIYSGIGYMAFMSGESNKGSKFVVPFGAGIKYSLSKNVGVGIEWGMRKTFNDYMDNVINAGEEGMKPLINNNDWYSFAGFFISFRLQDNSGNCPVYW